MMVFALAAVVPTKVTRAIVSGAREILATGDEVEGFGRIGYSKFDIVGISRDDRVVFTAETSTGAEGVFSADGNSIQALWLTSNTESSPVRLGRVRTNANRVVVAEGFATTTVIFDIDGIYQISAGAAVPVVEVGDITADGDEICTFTEPFVLSDTGAIGFSAEAARPGAACATNELSENLYVFEAGSVRRLFRKGNTQAPRFLPIGLADDGTLLVGLSDGSAILGVRESRVEPIVSNDDLNPSGEPFGAVTGLASNSLGEVVFKAGYSLYRTDHGNVVRVAEPSDTVVGKYELGGFSSAAVNDAGAVLLGASLQGAEGSLDAVVLLPPNGAPSLLAPSGKPGGINDGGVAAVLQTESQQFGSQGAVARGNEAPLERLAAFGDPAPDGGVFATGGLSISALATDGRVAVEGYTFDLSEPTLLCGDADGFVAVTGSSNPMPDGGSVAPMGTSFRFAESGLLFLGAEGDEPTGVYFAGAGGLERLVGVDDEMADGARISRLLSFTDPDVVLRLASNARGSVLVRARTDHGVRFVRRRPGGGLEPILFDLGPDLSIRRNIDAGIEDDDTVVVTVELDDGEYAILASDGTSARLLATGSDPRLPGGPFGYMVLPFVVGDRVVIHAMKDVVPKTLLYTDAAGFVPFFTDGIERVVDDATAGGRALLERYGRDRQLLLLPDGSLSLLTDDLGMGKPKAVAINDRDNVLFTTQGTEVGTGRDGLALAGPTPSGRCPRGPATETPEPTAAPSSTETSTPTATPPVTPTHTPKPTDAPTATQTSEPTQTASPTETTMGSPSPTTAGPGDSDDGCQVAPSRGSTVWPLLPMLVVLGGIFRRFPNRRVRRPSAIGAGGS